MREDPSAVAARSRPLLAHVLGAFFLVMGGINIGLAVGDQYVYRTFAEGGLFGFVREGWTDIVMAHPRWWIGLLAAGEIVIGLAFLGSRAWRCAAYLAAIAFNGALVLFGWGFGLWVVPALVVLWLGLRRELEGSRSSPAQEPRATSTR